jgi:general secretion pathway protein A
MYEKFFGFKERPFQLVPNPAYLFLGRSHEEALAHLTYAVRQGDGFVEITGEVGTGKTTLCRTFLDNLDESVEAAYIFNPMLTPRELLTAVRDELGIETAEDADVKTLLDAINAHLMERRRRNRRVILLIDEAQNLGRDVLEQLRLLSNLETRTSKLIQIILVGQPELRDILGSHELRQLGQRITLSCHLRPFAFRETMEYIRHRIRIASRRPGVRFTRGAFRAIHDFSGGVPRLVNIACDRALLTAYGRNRRRIDRSTARAAIRELAARSRRIAPAPRFRYAVAALLLLVPILAASGIRIHRDPRPFRLSFFESEPAERKPIPEPASAPESAPGERPESDPEHPAAPAEIGAGGSRIAVAPDADPPPAGDVFAEPEPEIPRTLADADLGPMLAGLSPAESRRDALRAVLRRWNPDADLLDFLDGIPAAGDFFRTAARRHSLEVLVVRDGLPMLRTMNLPAVLEISPDRNGDPVFLALTNLPDAETVELDIASAPIRAAATALEPHWRGVAYVPWRNFYGLDGIIPRNATDDAVVTLKTMLRDIGFVDLEPTAAFDDKTRLAVEYLQEKHRISVDGAVGPRTKIVLYNELAGRLPVPRLRDAERTAANAEREGRPL